MTPVAGTSPVARGRALRVATVVGALIVVAVLAARLLLPSSSYPPGRLVSWQLQGYIQEQTPLDPAVVRVYVAQWPSDPSMQSSWLVPEIQDTPLRVTITLHTSDAWASQTIVGMYDTGGSIEVRLGEPLGNRPLFDGSTLVPSQRTQMTVVR